MPEKVKRKYDLLFTLLWIGIPFCIGGNISYSALYSLASETSNLPTDATADNFFLKKQFDRFIPPRINSDIAKFNLEHPSIDSLYNTEWEDEENSFQEPIFENTAKSARNIISYRKEILKAIDVTHSNVLQHSDLKKKTCKLREVSPWPVRARRKPLMRMSGTVLDMPDIDTVDTSLYHHVIDWGKQGQIGTVFHGEVHIWSSDDGQTAETHTDKTVLNCIKWNHSGTRFAVSRTGSKCSVFDANTLKVLRTLTCKCMLCCVVTVIEWSKSGCVITGCSEGSINIIYTKACPGSQYFYKLLNGGIIDLKLSCNDTYLLAATIHGHISIFKWPLTWKTTIYFESESTSGDLFDITSTAWHPWKESLVAIGERNNIIAVWNLNNQKTVDFNVVEPYFKKSSQCTLDFLTFNPLSAELVVSFFYENPNRNVCNNFLTVFSDLESRVDEVRYHIGHVPCAVWDGTGTRLATVSTDENLVLWDFFGTKLQAGSVNGYQKAKKKAYDNIFDVNLQFGPCIR